MKLALLVLVCLLRKSLTQLTGPSDGWKMDGTSQVAGRDNASICSGHLIEEGDSHLVGTCLSHRSFIARALIAGAITCRLLPFMLAIFLDRPRRHPSSPLLF